MSISRVYVCRVYLQVEVCIHGVDYIYKGSVLLIASIMSQIIVFRVVISCYSVLVYLLIMITKVYVMGTICNSYTYVTYFIKYIVYGWDT